MSIFGIEYTFDKQENFEEFVNSMDLTPAQTQGFIHHHPNQKLVQVGDSYSLVTITPQGNKEVNFKSGVPFEEKVAERTCQTTFTLDGNTLFQVQKFEDGSEINFARVYSDKDIVITITSNKFDGIVRRYYKAI